MVRFWQILAEPISSISQQHQLIGLLVLALSLCYHVTLASSLQALKPVRRKKSSWAAAHAPTAMDEPLDICLEQIKQELALLEAEELAAAHTPDAQNFPQVPAWKDADLKRGQGKF